MNHWLTYSFHFLSFFRVTKGPKTRWSPYYKRKWFFLFVQPCPSLSSLIVLRIELGFDPKSIRIPFGSTPDKRITDSSEDSLLSKLSFFSLSSMVGQCFGVSTFLFSLSLINPSLVKVPNFFTPSPLGDFNWNPLMNMGVRSHRNTGFRQVTSTRPSTYVYRVRVLSSEPTSDSKPSVVVYPRHLLNPHLL